MYFFIAFIISIILLGSLKVGPLSIRVYATVIMMIYLLCANKKHQYIKIDRSYLKLYIIFLLLMAFSQFIIGEIIEFQYFKKLLAYHLVCIVAFFSIERYVNSIQDLKKTILVLIGIMLINNVATILQFKGNDIGWHLGLLFGDIQQNIDFSDSHDSLLGFSRTPGIFGNVVNNAFAIAVLCPLSLCLLNKGENKLLKIAALFSFIVSVVSCFMTQQRASFGLVLLCICIYLYVEFRKNIYAFFLFGVLIIIFGLNLNIGDIDMGRLSDMTNDSRSNLYNLAITFISNNPIFGGPVSYQRLTFGYTSHNIVLDSWISSGFFGFLVMMFLFIRTIILGLKTLYNGIMVKSQNRFMIFGSLAVLNAMFYGLTHNTSYLDGNVLIFIVLALLLKIISINNSFAVNDSSYLE